MTYQTIDESGFRCIYSLDTAHVYCRPTILELMSSIQSYAHAKLDFNIKKKECISINIVEASN